MTDIKKIIAVSTGGAVLVILLVGIIIQTARRKPELAATPEGQEQLKARRAAASILSGAASILSAVGILLEKTPPKDSGGAENVPC